MICRYIDEGVVGSGMGLFLIVGHWPKILPQTQNGPGKCVYCAFVLCMVYYFPPVAEICARLAGNLCQKLTKAECLIFHS
jgi:hypothetical protein